MNNIRQLVYKILFEIFYEKKNLIVVTIFIFFNKNNVKIYIK